MIKDIRAIPLEVRTAYNCGPHELQNVPRVVIGRCGKIVLDENTTPYEMDIIVDIMRDKYTQLPTVRKDTNLNYIFESGTAFLKDRNGLIIDQRVVFDTVSISNADYNTPKQTKEIFIKPSKFQLL